MPYRTTILGGAVDIGDGAVKAIGLAWLVSSVLFVVAAAATLMRAARWQPFVYTTVGLSTALCLLHCSSLVLVGFGHDRTDKTA
jgi:predicted anti-sigma-YlaC factor YlaD